MRLIVIHNSLRSAERETAYKSLESKHISFENEINIFMKSLLPALNRKQNIFFVKYFANSLKLIPQYIQNNNIDTQFNVA